MTNRRLTVFHHLYQPQKYSPQLSLILIVFAGFLSVPNHSRSQEDLSTKAENGSPATVPAKVTLSESQRDAANVKVTPAIEKPFSRSISLTGKVALNEEKLAHIYPIVSGQVESVNVALGDTVADGDILLRVHSREVGTAKLELYQATLQ